MRPDFAARKRTLAGRALALLLLSTAVLAGPVSGQGFDSSKTPVTPVPADRHGDLKPATWPDEGLPLKSSIIGDSSGWNFGSTPGPNNLFFYSVDVENGFVFAATGKGLMMWKEALETGDPNLDTAPVVMAKVYAPPVVPDWHQSDLKFYLHGIDAPDGDATVVAVASVFGNGMLIWRADDDGAGKKILTLKYQDSEKTGSQVWATKIGGVSYAFFAATNNKVLVYNMDAAKSIQGATCLDYSPATGSCPGVYKGKINTQSGVSYLGGTGNYLAASLGFLGVEIWNVADPVQPQRVLQAAPAGGTRGVALWKDGSSYYLAAVGTTDPALRIYDVSCITSNSCPSSLGNPVGSFSVHSSSVFVTASKKNGTIPFLYIGNEDQFTGGPQREYLLDVSNPAVPADITPVHALGYWGWYYYGNPTGFNWVMPRTAKFQGNFLYRAAYGLMDVHKHTGGGPPVANFDWSPATIYAGDAINFNDRSTGAPDGFTWTFQDGTPASSTDKNPAGVTFASTGLKSVNLHIVKGALVDDEAKPITVVDPVPQIGSMSVSPANPVVCQPITFKAEGVTGKPTLTYAWTLDSSPQTLGADPATFKWTPAQDQAGSHTAGVTVSNVGADSDSITVSVGAQQPLVTPYTPTNDPFTAGTVTFHANQTGSAVWWSWDFDDDANTATATWTAWTNDPVAGPNPSHTYTTKGIRTVRARVSQHCTTPDDSNAVLSLTVAVDIQNPIPLTAQFLAQCSLGFCGFSIGEAISFTDSSTGAEFYDYSWDGDTTFEDANHPTPVTSHVYTAQGDYQPKLQVRRGTNETDVFTLAQILRVRSGGNTTPSISITGPSSGNIGASLTFNANPSNCTATASGWTWNAGGGTLTGSGSSVTIAWASAGSKIVTASNSGCGSASGSKTVTISDTTPAVLKAEFTYSPVGAKEGELVSFNGTSSTGSPTSYAWSFGDGGTATGSTATHTYAAAGNYVVTLSVTKPGSGCAPAPFCESTVQKTVGIARQRPGCRLHELPLYFGARHLAVRRQGGRCGDVHRHQHRHHFQPHLGLRRRLAGPQRRHDRNAHFQQERQLRRVPHRKRCGQELDLCKELRHHRRGRGSHHPALDRPEPRLAGAVERPLRPQPRNDGDGDRPRVPQAGPAGGQSPAGDADDPTRRHVVRGRRDQGAVQQGEHRRLRQPHQDQR